MPLTPDRRGEVPVWLATVFDPPAPWRAAAGCRGTDPEVFFDPDRWPQARRVCRGCPVRTDCLDHALTVGESRGMWGGLTPGERRRLARHRPSSAPTEKRTDLAHGRPRRLDDDDLLALFAAADPDTPAIQVLRAGTELSRSGIYLYLQRARRIGAVVQRGRTLYPAPNEPTRPPLPGRAVPTAPS